MSDVYEIDYSSTYSDNSVLDDIMITRRLLITIKGGPQCIYLMKVFLIIKIIGTF